MQKVKNYINSEKDSNLLENFQKQLKDINFSSLVDNLNTSHDILCKYTSLLLDAKDELLSCTSCKGLKTCPNRLKGYRYTPEKTNDSITFSYIPCKYQQSYLNENEYQNNMTVFHLSNNLKNAKMKDIYTDDKNRVEIIKYLINYRKNYQKNTFNKGIYLYGNFGSGKTYLISALFNELAKDNVKCAIIYFPEFLRVLKSSFSNPESDYEQIFNYAKTIPLLLLDDIGAENITPFARDEILGSILQYRMENNLTTFFTSNLSLEELELHLSDTQGKIDKLKARRIIERIKFLADEKKLIGINRRN